MIKQSRKMSQIVGLLLLGLLLPLLAACGGPAADAPADAPAADVPAAPTAGSEAAAPAMEDPTAAPEATAETAPEANASGEAAESPINDKVMVIGLNQPPDTLFGAESQSSATTQVLFGTGSCWTNRSYDYQPTYCFASDEFPTLENGGVVSETVQVDPASISADSPIVIGGNLITDTATLEDTEVPAELPQLQITVKLNPDLRWEDGTQVTSADTLEAYRILNDPAAQLASRYTLDRISSVEAPDAETVVMTMVPGYLDFDYYVSPFAAVQFLPEHIYSGQSVDEVRQAEAQQPHSFGPYMVSENVPNDQTTLVSNPYFQTQPKIGTIIYKYVTEADQLLAQLEAGEVDMVDPIALALGQFPSLDDLEQQGKITAQYVPATVWEHVDFGIQRADGQPAFFDDVRVRQAIAYGTNRQEIIDQVLYGKTVVMNTYVPEDHPSFPTSGLEAYEYNPETAQALLDEAGWTVGANGIREKDGRKFAVTFYTTEGNPTRQSVSEVMQQNLRDIGIDVTLELVPGPAVLFKNGEDGTLSGRRFDMAMYAWLSGVDPSHLLYVCDQIPSADNGWAGQNNPGYCNPEFDTAARAALSQLNKEQRIQDDIAAQLIWNKDLPTFPLYQRVNIIAFSPAVKGVELDPTSQFTLYNIGEIDIDQ